MYLIPCVDLYDILAYEYKATVGDFVQVSMKFSSPIIFCHLGGEMFLKLVLGSVLNCHVIVNWFP